MGIAPYKTFTFDGVSSANYGVYLTGEGVFNSPERAVEMIEIPGRNGNFALDYGKFNNIEITYRAGIVDASESNFANKMSNVRNWLSSKVGYVRLEDEYNPNEYRMAVFKSGVEVEHEGLKTGEFDITFDCKPQRFLTSGETATAVANNGTISNPTLFDSEPLLAVKGYGAIDFNGYEVELQNVLIGSIVLYDGYQEPGNRLITTYTVSFDLDSNATSKLNSGDSIYLSGIAETVTRTYKNANVSSLTINSKTGVSTSTRKSGGMAIIKITHNDKTLQYGTSTTWTDSVSATITPSSGTATNLSLSMAFSYNGARTISITFSGYSSSMWGLNIPTIYGDSTKSALGNPTYIDCSIGEAYMINNNEILPLDRSNVVSIGAKLPKLAPGTNTFTYPNTVTELKVTPRWWKV